MMASLLVGCGNTPNEVMSTNQESLNVEEKNESEEDFIEEDTEVWDLDAPWRKAYIDYLNTNEEIAPYAQGDYGFTFALIYLDDNDVPELFVDTGVEAGGQYIATYYDDKVVTHHFSRIGSQYIERSGLVYTNTGHMDYYPLTITKLEDGIFTEIGSGISYVSEEDWEKMTSDENYPYILTYEWEDESVTEEQFNAKVAELYDLDQSKYPEDFNSYDEFVYQLENGKWYSYDHRYEFIAGDVNWDEAQSQCKKKGGYLATITCLNEAKEISAQLHEQGFDDYALYVGYRSCGWEGDEFYSYRWVDADGNYKVVMPSMYDYWYYEWPGYDYQDSEWSFEAGEQEYGLVKYNSETNMIYVFEAPGDLISVSPQYAGKMGYICEFD